MLIKHFPVATLFIIVLKDSVSPVHSYSNVSTCYRYHYKDDILVLFKIWYNRYTSSSTEKHLPIMGMGSLKRQPKVYMAKYKNIF